MKQRYFQHPEELMCLWPDLQPDRGKVKHGQGIQPWWRAPSPLRGAGMNNGPGHGKFFIYSPRNQRMLVKAMSTKNWAGRSWYHHGLYLQRRGAHTAGEMGHGFNAEHDKIDMKTVLAQWQREGDPHLFKVVLALENREQIDLKEFTRQVLREIERDLGKPLQWVAIDHHNTRQAHVHAVVRGRSEGQVLTIARSYLHGGIKQRAQETATHMLGPRTGQELEQAAERALQRQPWSLLDQSIKTKMDKERLVDDARLSPFEQRRMEQLKERDLAWREGEQWRMAITWEAKQMNEQTPQRKPHEQEQDTQKPAEQKKEERTEQDVSEQHRRAVIVDEMEQEMGWGR